VVLVSAAALGPISAPPAGATFYGGKGGELAFVEFDGTSIGLRTHLDNTTDVWGSATLLNGAPWDPSWSPDGTRIAYAINTDGNYEIWTANAAGGDLHQLTFTNAPIINRHPSWSPDGTKIVFATNRDGNSEIYTMNAADGSNATRLTNNGAQDIYPKYSPSGTKIAFESARSGNGDIYVMSSAGASPVKVAGTSDPEYSPDWSPDGKKIIFAGDNDWGGYLATVKPDGTGRTDVTPTEDDESVYWYFDDPVFSPDGTRIAYDGYWCDLDFGCQSSFIETAKTDGTGNREIAEADSGGDVLLPTWRPGPLLTNPVAPTIQGSAIKGNTLIAHKNSWYPLAGATFAYQWQRCSSTGTSCVNITNATTTRRVLSSSDVGHKLRIKVTGTNGSGSLVRYSATTATVKSS
jgi:Tol biopolymer transport system component